MDAPTSGLLVAAKTGAALRSLSTAFAERRVRKRYRAIVAGALGVVGGAASSIDLPLSGQSASTAWMAVSQHESASMGDVTLLDLWPHTGRTHQLRRHLSAVGHPILGDKQYWEAGSALRSPMSNEQLEAGLFLCAVELELPHPTSGETLCVTVPQPAKFDDWCESGK